MRSKKRYAAEVDGESEHVHQRKNHKRVSISDNELRAQHQSLSNDRAKIQMLKTLAGELVAHPDLLKTETDATKAADIAKAVSALNDAFKNSEVESLPAHDFSRELKEISRQYSYEKSPPKILDQQLEKAVFTHPSVEQAFGDNYDRLEVMGDAYIELIATRLIWLKYPKITAGRMSQLREMLVKNETLAEYSLRYKFDKKATIPKIYLDQPKRRTKTLGDIFEAYVAAVILSRPEDGFKIAEEWLRELWSSKLINVIEKSPQKHSKQSLAGKVLMKDVKLEYLEEETMKQNNDGTQIHSIGVYLTGYGWDKKHLGSGQGLSKAEAGEEAASNAFENASLMEEIITRKAESMAK